MKKIIIDKEESIAEIIDRMLADKEDELTLVIPKGSQLARTVSNFHLLKREADAAGKTISVESVDDTILAFARESDLEGTHPLWRGVRGSGGVSDIIPAGEVRKNPARGGDVGAAEEDAGETAEEEKTVRITTKGKKTKDAVSVSVKRKKKEEEPVRLTVQVDEEDTASEEVTISPNIQEEADEFEEKESRFFGGGFFGKRDSAASRASGDQDDEEGGDEDEDDRFAGGSGKLWWWIGGIVIAVVVVLGLMTWVFDHATVSIVFQKTPWTYQGNFTADDSASTVDATSNIIPAQLFTSEKNMTQSFPASGSANVSLKAQGTITVYNDYSAASQELVATTRFVTPDGKLFRLAKTITVPGATVTNGGITPSSIDAAVVADQPGVAYNVSSVPKLSIPGFQGSAKFNGFYGELKTGTSGGFTGTRPVPTASDISNAETQLKSALQSALTSNLTTSYPNNFQILSDATNVSMTKLTVNTTTDSNGDFSVFGDATLQAIGFDESVLKSFLLSLAQASDPSSTFTSSTLTYSNVQANFTKGTVSFAVSGTGTLEPIFDPDAFKSNIAGKSIGAARISIAALQGLDQGTISVWPIWLWGIPNNPNKIVVNAD